MMDFLRLKTADSAWESERPLYGRGRLRRLSRDKTSQNRHADVLSVIAVSF
jgi:hypothetical protein